MMMTVRREVVFLLAFLGALVAFIDLFDCYSKRGSSRFVEVYDIQNLKKQHISQALNLDDQIDRDRRLCEHVHLDGNVSSTYHRVLQRYSHILQEFIPQTFSPQFRNPCWYSHYPYTNDQCQIMPRTIKVLQHSKDSEHLYCLPTFFLAGFPKCGSTSLYLMIAQHPDVAPPKCKEGQFWSLFVERGGEGDYKRKQILWYLSHFSSSKKAIQSRPQAITLDASTSTLWHYFSRKRSVSEHCLVPSMVRRILPNAKFIVILRDPTKRLLSHYWFACSNNHAKKASIGYYSSIAKHMLHNVTAYAINLYQSCIQHGISTFECVQRVSSVKYDGVNSCAQLRLGVGMYYYHIVPWLNVFPRENFLFIRSEDLFLNPDVEMTKVWAFLELHNLSQVKFVYANQNEWSRNPRYRSKFTMLPETKRMLDRFYQPHNELLAKLLSDSKYKWDEVS